MKAKSGFAVLCGEHLVAFESQVIRKSPENCRIVFDDEHTRHVETSATVKGIRIVNVLPAPTALWTSTRPPCASAMCLTRVSPRPVPATKFVWLELTR